MPKVQLFIPCFVDQLFPQTGLNMAKVLEHFGCEVSFNPNQTCCGQPAYNAGYQDEAREIACKFVTDFNLLNSKKINCFNYGYITKNRKLFLNRISVLI